MTVETKNLSAGWFTEGNDVGTRYSAFDVRDRADRSCWESDVSAGSPGNALFFDVPDDHLDGVDRPLHLTVTYVDGDGAGDVCIGAVTVGTEPAEPLPAPPAADATGTLTPESTPTETDGPESTPTATDGPVASRDGELTTSRDPDPEDGRVSPDESTATAVPGSGSASGGTGFTAVATLLALVAVALVRRWENLTGDTA